MIGIVVLVAVVLGFIVSLAVTKKVAKKIYIITGYNGFDNLQRGLCASILIILLAVSIIAPDSLALGFLALVPIAILIFLNLKAKEPKYIVVLSILQVLYGISWFFFVLLVIGITFMFKSANAQLSMKLPEYEHVVLERANIIAKKKGFRDADDWASKEGLFSTAQEACRAGFFNDKLY